MKILLYMSSFITRNIKFQNPQYFRNCQRFISSKDNSLSKIDFTRVNKIYHDYKDLENIYETEESIHELEEYNEMFQDQDMPVSVKKILFPAPTDNIMLKLNNCASVQETFDVIKHHKRYIQHEHIAQSVLVLWDLQKMFYHVNLMSNTLTNQTIIIGDIAENYYKKLKNHDDFIDLIEMIKINRKAFTVDQLATVLMYLNKIGVGVKEDVSQLLLQEFNNFNDNIPISALSKLTASVYRKFDLSSHYAIQNFMPTIYDKIDKCTTAEDFKQCTMCLISMNKIVSDEVLGQYIQAVKGHLSTGLLNENEHRTLLKVILFLNFPQWRDNTSQLISKCMILLKDQIHVLNSYELLLFYEVFYKIQEPAILLTILQRQANKFLSQLQDESVPFLDVRLKLLMAVIVYSSPSSRNHYNTILKEHSNYHLNRNSIFEYYKLLTYVKNSDTYINKKFWNSTLQLMRNDETFRENYLLKICSNYLFFTHNVHNHRNFELEKEINVWLRDEIENGISAFIPNKFAAISAFIIVYGDDEQSLNFVLDKLKDTNDILNHIECLNLSKSLNYAIEANNPLMTQTNQSRLLEIIQKAVQNHAVKEEMDMHKSSMLLKTCIHNIRSFDEELVTQLITNCAKCTEFSTKLIKSISFCLHCTNSLIPHVIDGMVNYVCEHKDQILGFNAEKVVYLCYSLGYYPKKADKFFTTIIEIILRDQERLSGLSYLQSCLALSYFYQLPQSFIRKIFNTTFLDKLDIELTNCYYKDIYPVRVRNLMMQLNRAVCIDYPQCNIPWFHQKYIQELHNKDMESRNKFRILIKSYLTKLLQTEEILENVKSPYGYNIDFLLYLNSENELVTSEDSGLLKKVAVLLVKSKEYTNINSQLKGKSVMKIRHLEMLGYTVVVINYDLWKNLIYGAKKMEYLRNVIVPEVNVDRIINR